MNQDNSYIIFINKISGFVLNEGEDSIRERINESGLPVKSLEFLEPEALMTKLAALKESEGPILVGGGDGTIRCCVSALINKNIPFGVLPMGTMNLLAQDIGLPVKLEEAIAAYSASTAERNVDVGVVNDEYFLCCAGIGIMPEASTYRETLRENNDITMYPKLTTFVLERMDTNNYAPMQIEIPPRLFSMRTASLVVSNNQFAAHTQMGDNQFKKDSLQDGELGIYALESRGWVDRLRFFLKLGIGGWKSDPLVKEWVSPEATITTVKKTVPVSLDGEPIELSSPLKFSIKPLGLKMLIPGSRDHEEEKAA